MDKSTFLEQNKKEVAELIKELNKDNNPAVTDYLLDRINSYATNNDVVDFNSVKTLLKEELNDLSIESDVEESDLEYFDDIIKQYLLEVARIPMLEQNETIKLIERYQNGETDLEKNIIEGNLRLVVSIAKRYIKRGVPFLDLIQEGSIGMIQALRKFDLSKSYTFSTYATYWIRNRITRYIGNNARNVRIPISIQEKVRKYVKVKNKLYQMTGVEPSNKDIADILEIDEKDADQLEVLSMDETSLNKKINVEGRDFELSECLPENAEEKTKLENLKENSEIIRFLIDNFLNTREKNVILLRYGFVTGEFMKLEEVGKVMHRTKEAINKTEQKALKKLFIGARIYDIDPDTLDF